MSNNANKTLSKATYIRKIIAVCGFFALLAVCILAAPKIADRSLSFKGLFAPELAQQAATDLEPVFYRELGDYDSKAKTPLASSQFTVSIKVTSSRSEAETIVSELAAKGIDAYYTPMQSRGRVTYHVRSGIFVSEADANVVASRLKQTDFKQAKSTKLY